MEILFDMKSFNYRGCQIIIRKIYLIVPILVLFIKLSDHIRYSHVEILRNKLKLVRTYVSIIKKHFLCVHTRSLTRYI